MTTTPSSLAAPSTEDSLRSRVNELQSQLAEARHRVNLFETGAEIVAQALLDEALERDWCSEYDQFVDQLNGRLPAGFPRLRNCERYYHVSFRVCTNPETMSGLESDIDRILPSGVSTEDFQWERYED